MKLLFLLFFPIYFTSENRKFKTGRQQDHPNIYIYIYIYIYIPTYIFLGLF
ncbi:hypothetical protein ACMBCM_10355 [Spiroplasma sp. K1]